MALPVGGGAGKAEAGTSRIPIASDRNRKYARAAMRKELTDILYPGALTSRQKRYTAEPAPDMANLTLIDERTANGFEHPLASLEPIAGTDRPVARRFRKGWSGRAPRNCPGVRPAASGMFRTEYP